LGFAKPISTAPSKNKQNIFLMRYDWLILSQPT
jgi:hypothetical protein